MDEPIRHLYLIVGWPIENSLGIFITNKTQRPKRILVIPLVETVGLIEAHKGAQQTEKLQDHFRLCSVKEHLNIMSLFFLISLGEASALSDNPTESKYHLSEVTFAPCYHNLCHLIHYSTNSLSCLLDAR